MLYVSVIIIPHRRDYFKSKIGYASINSFGDIAFYCFIIYSSNMSGMDKQQVNVSQDKYKTVFIPLPPLAEQKRIVAKIEELMKYCDKL